MTMILQSNTRTGLRNSGSNTSLDNLLTKPQQEKRVSRNQRLSKPSSTRGLTLAKKAEARYQASRRHSNPRLVGDDDDDEEEEVVVEDMETAESDNKPLRRRGLARTTSMDVGKRPSIRRNLRRNKSCEGMPMQRRPLLDRSSSSRRLGSRRSLMDRSKSERRFALHDREQDKPMRPPSRSRMDGSSDDGARSSRRRRATMADDSSNNRRRVLPGRTTSMGGSSGGSAGSVRRRGTKSGRVTRSNSRRESSLRGLPDFEQMDSNSGRDITPDTSPARTAVSKRGKGLDDSSRRRKEPTLSKLSINELRNRLVGTEEKEESQGSDGSNSQGFEFEANWDNDIPPPLDSDLNKDQF